MNERDFSEDEMNTINSIIARNCEDLTSDEVELYAKWRSFWAAKEALDEEKQRIMDAESADRIDESRKVFQDAMEKLNGLYNASLDRLARIEKRNGQETK